MSDTQNEKFDWNEAIKYWWPDLERGGNITKDITRAIATCTKCNNMLFNKNI